MHYDNGLLETRLSIEYYHIQVSDQYGDDPPERVVIVKCYIQLEVKWKISRPMPQRICVQRTKSCKRHYPRPKYSKSLHK